MSAEKKKRLREKEQSMIDLQRVSAAIRFALIPEVSVDPEGWSDSDPGHGCQDVAAMYVYRLFGGSILTWEVDGMNVYFNELDFGNEKLIVNITQSPYGTDKASLAHLIKDAGARVVKFDDLLQDDDAATRYMTFCEIICAQTNAERFQDALLETIDILKNSHREWNEIQSGNSVVIPRNKWAAQTYIVLGANKLLDRKLIDELVDHAFSIAGETVKREGNVR